jgi:hypothetical protein
MRWPEQTRARQETEWRRATARNTDRSRSCGANRGQACLEPIFEADFGDSAYGYRPVCGAVDAVKEVHRLICRGYTDVVDADVSKYFDTIPHSESMKSVARRIADGGVQWLIKLWLKAPIEEREPRMPEIGTSGSMSRDGKRSVAAWPKLPRPSSTLSKEPRLRVAAIRSRAVSN